MNPAKNRALALHEDGVRLESPLVNEPPPDDSTDEGPGLVETPHALAVGMVFLESDGDEAILRVPYRKDLVGDPDTGVLHGGVITAALDHVCGAACKKLDLPPEQSQIATLDLRIDYMRSAVAGRDLTVAARCTRQTRTIAFMRGVAWDDDRNDPVATCTGTFMLGSTLPPKDA